MHSPRWSSRERIADGRRKLNQLSIELYLAAQEKEDERELARIVRSLELATTELQRAGRDVGMRVRAG